MEFRLGELECGSCGYFERLVGDSSAARAGGRTVLPGQAGQPPVPRLGIQGSKQGWGWRLVKFGFLLVVFTAFIAGTLYKAFLEPTFVLTAGFAGSVLAAALLITGLTALVLFIDWRALRIAAEALIALLVAVSVYELALWDGQDQIRLALLVLNTVLLVALGAINFVEIRRM